jgi:hypothetical protein
MGKKSRKPSKNTTQEFASGTHQIGQEYLSEEYLNQIRMSMDASAIPDLTELLKYVNSLISFVETPEMMLLSKTNYEEYERRAYQRYNQHMPIKIIGMMVNEEERYENLERLLDMFDRLDGIKSGKKNMQEEYADFSEKLNEQYLYPEYGGTKESFIKAMEKSKEDEKEDGKEDGKEDEDVEIPIAVPLNETVEETFISNNKINDN